MENEKKLLDKIIHVKEWKIKTKIIGILILICLVVATILFATKPTETEMAAQASPEMQKLIKLDESHTRKHVTVTYNSLIVINYCSFTSSGANELNEKYVGFAGKIYEADDGAGRIAGQMVNYTYRMLGCGENWMHGAKLTILLTTLCILFGILLGTFLALGEISRNPLIHWISNAYVFFFRSTPLLIQLFVVYFTIPGVFGFAWRDLFSVTDQQAVYEGAFVAALISFSLNSGAYCAEVIRAAIQSIDNGQYEAAKALGMGYGMTMYRIVIPQSVRRMIPPLCNEFVIALKDASLVFAIALMDITTISKNIMTSEGSYLVFIPAMVIYLIITAVFNFFFKKIEEKCSVYE